MLSRDEFIYYMEDGIASTDGKSGEVFALWSSFTDRHGTTSVDVWLDGNDYWTWEAIRNPGSVEEVVYRSDCEKDTMLQAIGDAYDELLKAGWLEYLS